MLRLNMLFEFFCGVSVRLIRLSFLVFGILPAAAFSPADLYAQAASPSQQAIALEQQGQLAEAEQAWQSITVQNPQSVEAWAHLGLVRARLENYPAAVTAYRQTLKLDPRLPGLQLDLGLALFKDGKFHDAIAPLKAASAEKPNDAGPKTLLGMSYYGTQQYREAVPYLEAAVKASPDNIQVRGVLAQSCLYAAQYNCTMEQYKRIIVTNPDSAPAHMLAGEAYDGLNRRDEAIAEFEAAEKAAPAQPNVHFGLGYLLWKQQSFEDAAREFRLEIQNDPSHAQALAYLGDTQMKNGGNAEAKATLQQAVKVPGAARLAWLDLGILLAQEHENDEAVADIRHAIEMDPSEVDAHWRLARLYQSMGRADEAKAEFAKTTALHKKADEGLVEKMSGPGERQP